ncbi:MAG: hypothetical protein AAF927_02415 [Bacteroidota bacterium]
MRNYNRPSSPVPPFFQPTGHVQALKLFFREFIDRESKFGKWLRDTLQRVLYVPATLSEVLMRRNFGEQYYKIGTIILFMVGFWAIGQLAPEFGRGSEWYGLLKPVVSLQPDSLISYLFLALYGGLACFHYLVIKRRIWQRKDLEFYSRADGTPHEWLWRSLENIIHATPMVMEALRSALVWMIAHTWGLTWLAARALHLFVVKQLHRIPALQRFSFSWTIPPQIITSLTWFFTMIDQLTAQAIVLVDRLIRRVQFNEYIVKRYAEPILVSGVGYALLTYLGADFHFVGILLLIGGSSSFIRAQIEFTKGRRYLLNQNDKRIVGEQLKAALNRKTPTRKVAGVSLPFLPARDPLEQANMWAALEMDSSAVVVNQPSLEAEAVPRGDV